MSETSTTSSSSDVFVPEDFYNLFEDRAFVDHFNVFLMLPVFGQNAIYIYETKEIEFFPQIRRSRLFLSRDAVMNWLYNERFPAFQQTKLYLLYKLHGQIKDVGFYIEDTVGDVQELQAASELFTTNLLSSVLGMQRFVHSLTGTVGERVVHCWLDIAALRTADNNVTRKLLLDKIKMKYINELGDQPQSSNSLAYLDILNFEVVPANHCEILEGYVSTVHFNGFEDFILDSTSALQEIQHLLIHAVRTYWLPRYVLHVFNVLPVHVLQSLFGDGVLEKENVQRLIKRRMSTNLQTMPREESVPSHDASLAPHQLWSASGDSLSSTTLSEPLPYSLTDDRKTTPFDLLSLWAGGALYRPSDLACESEWSLSSLSDDTMVLDEDQSEATNSPIGLTDPMSSCLSLDESFLDSMVLPPLERAGLGMMPGHQREFLIGGWGADVPLPKANLRIVRALACDCLAGCPFRRYLHATRRKAYFWYVQFWMDVQTYLRSSLASRVDPGHSGRLERADRICSKYLHTSAAASIFSQRTRQTLKNILVSGADEHLLFAARDIVSAALGQPWKEYAEHDKRNLIDTCFSKLYMNKMKQRLLPSFVAPLKKEHVFLETRPQYFEQTQQSVWDCMDSPGLWSQPLVTQVLCEEHCWKSLELAIAVYEGPMEVSANLSLSLILKSLHGSLDLMTSVEQQPVGLSHVTRLNAKISVANLCVCPDVCLPEINVPDDVRVKTPHNKNLPMLWRDGSRIKLASRPPRNFLEVLTDSEHYTFFKAYLVDRRANMYPLYFWRAVEDMKHTQNTNLKRTKSSGIVRRFFGKESQKGCILDCRDPLIQTISLMKNPGMSALIAAQLKVAESMEAKWFNDYLALFDQHSANGDSGGPATKERSPAVVKFHPYHLSRVANIHMRSLDPTKRSMLYRWNQAAQNFIAFIRCLNRRAEWRIFEMYLKQLPLPPDELQELERVLLKNVAMNMTTASVMCAQEADCKTKEVKEESTIKELVPKNPDTDSKEEVAESESHALEEKGSDSKSVSDAKGKVPGVGLRGADSKHAPAQKENRQPQDSKAYTVEQKGSDPKRLPDDKEKSNSLDKKESDSKNSHDNKDKGPGVDRKGSDSKHTPDKEKGLGLEHKHGTKAHHKVKDSLSTPIFQNLEYTDKDMGIMYIRKLPRDLQLWLEINKYNSMVESLKYLTQVTPADALTLLDKAMVIIKYFFASEGGQKLRVNVPEEMVHKIIKHVNSYGPDRSLFHEPYVKMLPVLFRFWKKFHEDWPPDATAAQYLRVLKLHRNKAWMPSRKASPDDRTLEKGDPELRQANRDGAESARGSISRRKDSDEETVRGSPLMNRTASLVSHSVIMGREDEPDRISFSLRHGVRAIVVAPRSRRMTFPHLGDMAGRANGAAQQKKLALNVDKPSLTEIPLSTNSFTAFWGSTAQNERV